MKKLLILLLCIAALVVSGCGDKFAKEKEAVSKAEKAAMSMQLPVVIKPDNWKQSRPTKQEGERYQAGLNKLITAEKKILAEMQKSDAQISQMLRKASDESEKYQFCKENLPGTPERRHIHSGCRQHMGGSGNGVRQACKHREAESWFKRI